MSNDSIPFDVAGTLVEIVLKEAELIDRLFSLLCLHLSSEEMTKIAEEIKPTAKLVNTTIGDDAIKEV